MLQSFLAAQSLDTAAYISVFAFALAIPLLSCNILMNLRRNSLAIIASFTGLAFSFLHICWIGFVIFLGSTGIASLIYFTNFRR
jgi:hypothetical protein